MVLTPDNVHELLLANELPADLYVRLETIKRLENLLATIRVSLEEELWDTKSNQRSKRASSR